MSNILINPNSGIMEFSTGVAGGSSFIPNLNFTGGSSYSARLSHDNFGGLNIVSYTTGSGIAYSGIERFSIDGNNGRLFSVTDNLSGSLFSVNDIAGLPIIEAFDDNTVVMGAFNRNDFVLTGNSLGLGGLPNTGTTKLLVNGNLNISSGNVTYPVYSGATGFIFIPDASTSTFFDYTLSGNSTLNQPINMNNGQSITLFLTQDASGNRNMSFNSGYLFSNGINPTLNLVPSGTDIMQVIKTRNKLYCTFASNY